MLRIRYDSNNLVRVGARVILAPTSHGALADSMLPLDPLIYLINQGVFLFGLEPSDIGEYFPDTGRSSVRTLVFSQKPFTIRTTSQSYDDRYYGTFLDQLQNFEEILFGNRFQTEPNQSLFENQTSTRHRSLVGEGVVGLQSMPTDLIDNSNLLLSTFKIKRYVPPGFSFQKNGNSFDWTNPIGSWPSIMDLRDVVDTLSTLVPIDLNLRQYSHYSDVHYTLQSISYTVDERSYKIEYVTHIDVLSDRRYSYTWHSTLSGAGIHVIEDPDREGYLIFVNSSPTIYSFRIVDTDDDNFSGLSSTYEDTSSLTSSFFLSTIVPVTLKHMNGVIDVEGILGTRLHDVMDPFCNAVDNLMPEITPLSRDTAVDCISAIEIENDPDFNKLHAVHVTVSAGTSFLDKIENIGSSEIVKLSLNDISKRISGFGLMKYRPVANDLFSLISSLKELGALKNVPSKLFTSSRSKTYPVTVAGRFATIRVNSKAYLYISPFELLKVLIGVEEFNVLLDLLRLYYSSLPLGGFLLTFVNLKPLGDLIGSRSFYGAPLFFVHSYEVETQLTQADMDYLSMSSIGRDIKIKYYMRDVTRHLPVMRLSKLSNVLYSDDSVIHAVISLGRRLASLLVQ